MSDDSIGPIMSDNDKSLEVILVRMEGKIDRMGDRMNRYEQDISGIRSRLHDFANVLTPIQMLDLPGRIRVTDAHFAALDARLNTVEGIELQRKGAANLAKVLWAVVGAVGVGGAAAVLRVIQIGGF